MSGPWSVFRCSQMPGKTQDYVYTFRKPGVYHVLCLEYCGVGHHTMAAKLHVVPRARWRAPSVALAPAVVDAVHGGER